MSALSRRLPLRRASGYGSVRCVQTAAQPNLTYPLYPSVAQLMKQNNIPANDVSKITATGPNGRILKGDVLSYLGSIAANYPADLASQLAKNSRLDLSNIKIAAPQTPSPAVPAPQEQSQAKEEAKSVLKEEEAESVFETKVAVPVSFSKLISVRRRIRSSVGVEIPLATFVSRAADIANENLPVQPSSKQRSSALFDEILGQRPSASAQMTFSRGDYIPEIVSPAEFYGSEVQQSPRQSADDIIYVLTGRSSPKKRTVGRAEEADEDKETSIFSLTIPEQEEARAMAFLEKMQVLLEEEPAQLLAL
ncbi:pyridoxine biosynthesis protein [Microsporum audouinii]